MTPKEYEELICEYFSQQGYRTELTPYNNDYGVDVFAYKNNCKIAIQAKMFGQSTRKINRQMVMELHGVKDYFDCDKAILCTDGTVLDSALEVAKKLGIEISFLYPEILATVTRRSVKSEFERIWENYIKPLEGKTLFRDNGESNKIVKVDWSGITRITSNGREQLIKIEIFRLAIQRILSEGSITRDYINQEYKERASSGIILILSQIPIFECYKSPLRIVRK